MSLRWCMEKVYLIDSVLHHLQNKITLELKRINCCDKFNAVVSAAQSNTTELNKSTQNR